MEVQGELFGKNENIILAHDEDDPPPKVGYAELHWWFVNRWAEETMRLARLIGILALVLCFPAVARNSGQWADEPANIREWFRTLMQPDNPYMSCCGEADAFEADTFEVEGDHYVAIITDGKGIIPNGTRIPIPNQKMKWDKGNPTEHGIVFIGSAGQIYCYVTPGGV